MSARGCARLPALPSPDTRGRRLTSLGLWWMSIAAHEPEGTTIGPSVASSTSSVCLVWRRASAWNPPLIGRLSATGLIDRELYVVSGPFEQCHSRLAHVGIEAVDQTGDKQLNWHRPSVSRLGPDARLPARRAFLEGAHRVHP